MADSVLWWLTLEAIGLISFPIAFAFFRFLPDRGYAFSKILGLLLMAYLLWIGATAHVIPNARWSIVLILAAMVAGASTLAWRAREEIAGFLRDRWRYLLLVEGLFSGVFFFALYFRSHIPDIGSTQAETLVDFAYINGILKSEYFPPNDPWLSGHSIPTYYFGHLIVAAVTKLVGTPPEISYNLGLALFISLAGIAAFGLVYNLVASLARQTIAVASGLAGLLLLIVMGNVEGLFELLAAHGVGSARFYQVLDFEGLDGPRSTTEWYPTEFYWQVRAIFIGGPAGEREFPFFTFAFGYLHGHLMSIPFILLTMAATLNLWRWAGLFDWSRVRSRLPVIVMAGLILGATGFTNSLDLPSLALLLISALMTKAWLGRRWPTLAGSGAAVAFSLLTVALAVALYLPYYFSFKPEGSFLPLEAARQIRFVQPLGLTVTFPHHLLYTWLPFFFLILPSACLALAGFRPARAQIIVALLPAALVLVAWTGAVLIDRGPAGLWDEAQVRDFNMATLLILAAMLALVVLALMGRLVQEVEGDPQGSLAFGLLLAAVGLLLILGIELFWIEAFPRAGTRIWTALHVNFLVWILFSVSGALCLYHLLFAWRAEQSLARAAKLAWVGSAAVVLLASFVYPVTASFSLTGGFTGDRTLNALDSFKRFAPNEYAAIQWLASNVDGSPVILEAVGDSYTPFGQVSTISGLPTLLEWPSWHETQWRASADFVEPRTRAAELIYTTRDPEEARALLDQFDVKYVYVGGLERQQYGEEGLPKFATFMEVVFQNETVTIYRMPGN